MLQTRLCLVLLLLAAAFGLGKSPADTSTVCDRYQRSDVIFTGTAETAWITMVDTRRSPVHKRSEKSKRVRFLVREWFKGQRRNMVEVWMMPSDCPLRMEADQTYLVYARVNKDKNRIESSACMGTVAAVNAASDLAYLAAAQLGPSQATRIFGDAHAPGVNIVAKSPVGSRYAITGNNGQFTIDGLAAGDWTVSIVGGTAKQVHVDPGSCVDVELP